MSRTPHAFLAFIAALAFVASTSAEARTRAHRKPAAHRAPALVVPKVLADASHVSKDAASVARQFDRWLDGIEASGDVAGLAVAIVKDDKVLLERGKNFVRALGDPHRLSSWRTVIAVAERMPEVGRKLYESGPARGLASLTAYLKAQVEAGILAIDDCEIAAAQFIETCHATMLKPMLFNFGPPPTEERIARLRAMAAPEVSPVPQVARAAATPRGPWG